MYAHIVQHTPTNLDELQDKVRVFTVELSRQTVQAPPQAFLVNLHELLTLLIQLHTDSKLVLPI